MNLEKEERVEKVGGGVLSPLEQESADLIAGKRKAQSLISDSQSSPLMSTSQITEERDEEENDETDILDYKREKEEEEEDSQYTPEEVGIMASKYPYSNLYRNLKVNKQADSSWFDVQNNGRTVAIIPVSPGALKSPKQASEAAKGLLRQVAAQGLVKTLKSRGGRIAQNDDPGVVGGGVRDFVPMSDPSSDQSVGARPDSDMQTKRTRQWSEPISPGEFPDHQRPHDPKSLQDMVMDGRTTDFADETGAPPMPLNVTNRQDSDMRHERTPKNVMDNALQERVTDMKHASRPNPWTQEARRVANDPGKDPGFPSFPEGGAVQIPEPSQPIGGPSRGQPPEGGAVPLPEAPKTLPRFPGEEPGAIPIKASRAKKAITPPGMENVVQKLKKNPDVDNPWAVAWSMYEKKGQAGFTEEIIKEVVPPAAGQEPPVKEPSTWEKIMAPIQPKGPGKPGAPDTWSAPGQQQMPEVEGQKKGRGDNQVVVSSNDFKTIVADIENRIAKKFEKQSASWKKAHMERLMRSLLLAADRQRLNQEPCSLKMAMGDVLTQPQRLAGIPMEGMGGDAIYAIVEAAFQSGTSPFIKSLIRQAMKFMDMPQEAFLAIEADTRRLNPVDVRIANDEEENGNGNGENGDEDIEEMIEEKVEEEIDTEQLEEMDRNDNNGNGAYEEDERMEDEERESQYASLRRQASKGNMLLAASPQAGAEGNPRFSGLRQALRSPLTGKFPKLLGY